MRSGADGVSIDVTTTRDGTLVCFADDAATRARLLGDAGPPLAERRWEEVAELRLGPTVTYARDTLEYAAEGAVPRLESALALLPRTAPVLLRLPPPTPQLPNGVLYRVAGRAGELLERMGLLESAVVTSSDALALHRARRATRGKLRTAYEWADTAALMHAWRLRDSGPEGDGPERGRMVRMLERIKTSGPARRLIGSATAAAIEFTAFGADLLRELTVDGALTGTFTVFPLDLDGVGHGLDGTLQARILARLASAGLDWVETDDPQRARAVVDHGWVGALAPHG